MRSIAAAASATRPSSSWQKIARHLSVMQGRLEPDRLGDATCLVDQGESLRHVAGTGDHHLAVEEGQGERDRVADPARRRQRLGAQRLAAREIREVQRLREHRERRRARKKLSDSPSAASASSRSAMTAGSGAPEGGLASAKLSAACTKACVSSSARARRAAWSNA